MYHLLILIVTLGVSGAAKNNYQIKMDVFKIDNQAQNVDKIDNLYKILEKFELERCMVIVNNYKQININPEFKMPIILKRFLLANFTLEKPQQNFKLIQKNVIYVPIGTQSVQWNISTNLTNMSYSCPPSRFYFPLVFNFYQFKACDSGWSFWNSNYCFELDFDSFSSASRPWYCEIQVELFLPNDPIYFHNFPQIFKHSYQLTIPRLLPSINVLIDIGSVTKNRDALLLIEWITRNRIYIRKTPYTAVTDIQTIVQVFCKRTTDLISPKSCKLAIISLLLPCLECVNLFKEIRVEFNQFSMAALLFIDKGRQNEIFVGGVKSDASTYHFYRTESFRITNKIEKFSKHEKHLIVTPFKNIQKIQQKYHNKLDILAFCHAYLYTLLLGNVTSDWVVNPKTNLKLNHRGLDLMFRRIGYINEDPFFQPTGTLKSEHTHGRLRFVSCGRMGIQPFHFFEFLSAFDSSVWKWIILTIVVLVFDLLYSTGRKWAVVFNNNLLFIVKVLLEQGDPFPQSMLSLPSIRYIISGFLLAGLVLSNAYKSTNVYNILSPRTYIPYTKLDQLLHDNFSLYTRQEPDYNSMPDYEHWGALRRLGFVNKSYLNLVDGKYDQQSVHLEINIAIESLARHKSKGKRIVERLYKYSQAHKNTTNLIFETVNNILTLARIVIPIPIVLGNIKMNMELQKIFFKKQDTLLFNDLNNCFKSAWILPEYTSHEISKKLKMLGKEVSVGIEAYTQPYITFTMQGLFPTLLMQRIQMIRPSGIFEWFPKLVNNTEAFDDKSGSYAEFTKPNMSGNIQVIFYLFGICVCLSTACMVLELRKIITGWVLTTFKYFLERGHFILNKIRKFIKY